MIDLLDSDSPDYDPDRLASLVDDLRKAEKERGPDPQPLDHFHSYTPDEHACPRCGGHTYEVQIRASRSKVTAYIFRSWSGQRFLDGEEYEGPVYYLGSNMQTGWNP